MKLVVLGVRNLGKLLSYLEEKGYKVEEATNMVLTDNSEVGEWEIKDKDGKIIGRILAHYIRHYYAAIRELPSTANDREILERLLRAKYVDGKWSSPVEPVIVIGMDELSSILDEYVDDYPNDKAKLLVEQYFIDGGIRVMTRLARKVVENLGKNTSTASGNSNGGGNDEGSISRTGEEGSTG